ncbi:MAG: carbohydrate kinase family protein [Chloroflexi bacterium]|nr:MAG: carbohydrate kinase family protein [Chloroflexota bacterium]
MDGDRGVRGAGRLPGQAAPGAPRGHRAQRHPAARVSLLVVGSIALDTPRHTGRSIWPGRRRARRLRRLFRTGGLTGRARGDGGAGWRGRGRARARDLRGSQCGFEPAGSAGGADLPLERARCGRPQPRPGQPRLHLRRLDAAPATRFSGLGFRRVHAPRSPARGLAGVGRRRAAGRRCHALVHAGAAVGAGGDPGDRRLVLLQPGRAGRGGRSGSSRLPAPPWSPGPGTQVVHAEALPARVVDTTGAGDALAGAFLARWQATSDLNESLRWGVAAAALAIEDVGVRSLARATAQSLSRRAGSPGAR